jgi:hypothetical protein
VKLRLKKLIAKKNKLCGVSKEISMMIKEHKDLYEEKYRNMIKQWCKSYPLTNSIKAIWKFIEAIQNMINN